MTNDFEGYVTYCKEGKKETPFGIISNLSDRKASSNFTPYSFKKFLIHTEDKRFFKHYGIDVKGTLRAVKENFLARRIVQGGSTITQQLARNLLRDNRKSYSRKSKEAIKAFSLEREYTKEQILHLYFSNVFFGKNLRGLRAASLYYFKKEIEQISQTESLILLTILRGPNFYLNNPEKFQKRFLFLNESLYKHKLISKNRYKKNCKTKISLQENHLEIFRANTLKYISEKTSKKKRIIHTTIERKYQEFANHYVNNSKYPVSIIALKKGKVVCAASSYGSEYPFLSKNNVGSTLKPFLYCFLRDLGISRDEKFEANYNALEWEVREVVKYNKQLNIQEALLYSNNNSFINACIKAGQVEILFNLAITFKGNPSDFVPSSILGSTKNGISLYELASAYSDFFRPNNLTYSQKECLSILNKIFSDKLGFQVENAFLKTGTTNGNKERYAVLGNPEITFAVLRNENLTNDSTKEGGFMNSITKGFFTLLTSTKNYKWS